MRWSDFTREEKKAIIRSAALIANADGRLSGAEDRYLTLLTMKLGANPALGGDSSILNDAMRMSNSSMESVIHYMNYEKKSVIWDIWLQTASQGASGNIVLSTNFPEEASVVKKLCNTCGVEYKDHNMIYSSF